MGFILLEDIKHNDLISEKQKKICKYLNDVEHFLILASTVTGCVSIATFTSLVAVPVCITNSPVKLKIYAVTTGIKKYKSIIKKKKKKHNEIVLLGKSELNAIEDLTFKALSNSYISHEKFVSLNNELKEYNEMKSN